jgi:arylsulfatase A-like enzyme
VSLRALALAAAALLAAGCSRAPSRPSIVLVIVDTLRADALGCYGAAARTPGFDAIAAGGVRFEHASAQAPWTAPSIASILTSQYPHEHGIGVSQRAAPSAQTRSLSDVLAERGYRTAAFVELPCDLIGRGFASCTATAGTGSRAAETFAGARRWMEAQRAPFFVLIHTYEVHDYLTAPAYATDAARRAHPGYGGPFLPRDPPPRGEEAMALLRAASPGDVAFLQSLYAATVARVDGEIAGLDRALGAGPLRDTIVAVTSDHGEGFDPARRRVHHGGRLHEDLLHVPLLLRWPGRLTPAVVDAVVESIDLAPTLLGLAQLPAYAGHRGKPLLQRGADARFTPRAPAAGAFSEESAWRVDDSGERVISPVRQVALQERPYKLIKTGARLELFDLVRDPGETTDLAASRPDRVDPLLRRLEAAASHPALDPAAATDAAGVLRALGYVR